MPRSRLSTGHTTAPKHHDTLTGRHKEVIVVNRPAAQCLWASAPERGHFVDLVEHAVQPLENENEGRPHGLRRPVSDGQHLHDVAPQPSALHGQGVVGSELQQGVGDLRQPAKPTAATSPIRFSCRQLRRVTEPWLTFITSCET